MGGAQKHMLHPYDDLDITFSEWFQMAVKIHQGGLFEEKLDGCNLTWKWDQQSQQIILARNWGHFRHGGQTICDYRVYLKGHPAEIQFTKALDNLEKLTPYVKTLSAFIPSGAWFNMEVIDKDSPQMLKYDYDTFAIHNFCKFVDEPKNPHVQSIPQGDISLEAWASIFSLSGINVIHKSMIEVPQGGRFYWQWMARMNTALENYDLGPNCTLREYCSKKAIDILMSNGIDFVRASKLAENITGPSKWKIKEIRIGLTKKQVKFIDNMALSKNKIKTMNLLLENIKEWWLWFGAKRLEGLSSNLVISQEESEDRLGKLITWNEVLASVKYKYSHPQVWEALEPNLHKFRNLEVKPQILEGLVIMFGGKKYKLTGAFQSLNQICGAVRYQVGENFPENWSHNWV